MKNQVIYINMLGVFSITYNGVTISNNDGGSSRIWSILAYLIVYRYRTISQSELIDVFWNDDNISNPLGALKTLIYRARAYLDNVGLDGKDIIKAHNGSYMWNCDENNMEIDIEKFEEFCNNGIRFETDEDKLKALTSALTIYQGDFLSNMSNDSWIFVPFSAYYSNMYIKTVYAAIDILESQEQYEEELSLCQKAVSLSPYDEILNTHLIIALVKLGQRQNAVKHCKSMIDILHEQFGVSPSDSFMDLYRSVLRNPDEQMTTISVLAGKISESAPKRGGHYCEFDVFKEICRFDFSSKLRTGNPSFIGLLTIQKANGKQFGRVLSEQIQDILCSAIQDSLRNSDCFSKVGVSQISVLLQNTNYENGMMALSRVINAFKKRCSIRDIDVIYSLENLL